MLDRPGAESDPSASKGGQSLMTKNMTLVLCASSFALVGLVSLQGCDVGETSSGPAAGAPAAGAPAAGAHSAGAPGAGAAGAHAGAGGATGGAGGAMGGAGGAAAGAGGAAAGAAGSTAGTGGATAGAGGSTAGAGGSSAGGGASGAAGSGGGASASKDCTTFCADEMTTCTFGAAAPAAYTDLAACQTACGAYTTGDVGVYPAGPTSGNTYACRRWHLSKAATVSGTDKSDHCQHTKQTSTTCI